jgi:hypothetical protein
MHSSLEERWGIGEAKVHDARDIGALWGFERSFVLVFFRDTDIVVTPADVKLREE